MTITSGNAVASYDVAGTTVTGGTYIFSMNAGSTSNGVIDISPYEIFIAPGETLTISGGSTVSSGIGVCLTWSADL